ncbi:MAG: XcyI family restriction endonuclease [Chloroflexia bacterium]
MQRLTAGKAVDLYEALLIARRLQLQPALGEAVKAIGVAAIDAQLNSLVPADALTRLAQLGLRGERVFPVPAIIEHAPPLIGYYRMLLGISKKEFGNQLGYRSWVSAEEGGRLRPQLSGELEQFCTRLIEPLTELVNVMGVFTDRDLSDLTLLTLGPTLQGGRNTSIGKQSARLVFDAVKSIIEQEWITYSIDRLIRFITPAGKVYEVIERSDPDLSINQGIGVAGKPVVAIEIKGGGDASNAHNRAGEAEKSQLKAKLSGYAERWTVIKMGNIDPATIASHTPSSTDVFEFNEIADRTGSDWKRFKAKLLALLELPLSQ